jgi:hypothetical protein
LQLGFSPEVRADSARSGWELGVISAQSHIGWANFLKGRISRDYLTYVQQNEENSKRRRKEPGLVLEIYQRNMGTLETIVAF